MGEHNDKPERERHLEELANRLVARIGYIYAEIQNLQLDASSWKREAEGLMAQFGVEVDDD